LDKLRTPHNQAMESQTGTRLEVVGNGCGRGLADLCAGLADVAMIGGSLKGVAEATNQEKPVLVKTEGLVETPVTALKFAFVTHPGVGVKTLTEAQLRDPLTGKTANWKDGGGPDLPVKLVLPFPGDGVRISLQESILTGAEFAKAAILRNIAKDIVPVVRQLKPQLRLQ
jgi:phosphate transport system substrate-binding protein